MGRYKRDFEKNRCKKIERHRIKRKNKHYNPTINNFATPKAKKECIKSKALNILYNNNFYTKIQEKNSEIKIKFPKIFCFIDNPNDSIEILKQINTAIFDHKVKKIYFDYSDCELLGLDASLVTDVIVLEGVSLRKKIGLPTKLEGNFPKTPIAIETFLTSGLIKHLGISDVESPNVRRLDPFAYEKDTHVMTNKVIEYYNNCLSSNGFILNEKGITHFSKLVGEIIGNADEHSGKNGTWYISGHFSKSNQNSVDKGRLTFISFGNTIYESLKSDTTSEKIKKKLNNHTRAHSSLFNIGWNEESSWTVFALQWMISRLKTDDNDRGTGTIKFIDSFTELGKTINNDIPKMAILSGHTHILFDGTYTLKEKNIGKNTTKVIAFNPTNDLKKRPDEKYVKLLENKFPGTIISCEFYVDKEYLTLIKEEDKNEKQN